MSVWCLGFSVPRVLQVLPVQGLESRRWGFGFRVEGLGYLGLGFLGFWDLGFRALGLRFRGLGCEDLHPAL